MTKVSKETRARCGRMGRKWHRVKQVELGYRSRCGLYGHMSYWSFLGDGEIANAQDFCKACDRSTHISAYWDKL